MVGLRCANFGRDEGEFVWHHMKNLAVVLSAARNDDILWLMAEPE